MKKTQLLKGVLEGCVLLIISESEVYGYEMVQRLKEYGFEEMVGGTVYPLLQKLEKKEYISSITKPSADGPDRKYYYITSIGIEYSQQFINQWEDLSNNVNKIISLKGRYLNEETKKPKTNIN
ncbi:PadR family transcriptional regulator [Carnobacterium maltaromaticum]|uniref:PadR family transcriptional regulator n=1 Tax=Carnobacterium maltaromaticum TaxID=2751 RepID=UPI0037BB5F5B